MRTLSATVFLLALGTTSCVSATLKDAVSAYATAVEHEATSSKKLLAECLTPPPGTSEDIKRRMCEAAAEGYDAMIASAKKLETAVSK